MPSDKHNCVTAEAMGLVFSLFDVASAREVLLANYSTYNAFFIDLPVSPFVFHSSLLTAKDVDLVVHTCDDFLCVIHNVRNENRPFLHSGYFHYRGAFDLYR